MPNQETVTSEDTTAKQPQPQVQPPTAGELEILRKWNALTDPCERVLAALIDRPGVNGHALGADAWAVTCPAHDDDGAALTIRRMPRGLAELRCSRGCGAREIIAKVQADPRDVAFPEQAAALQRLRGTRVEDLEVTAASWLVPQLIERATLSVIYGKPGSGKSFLAIDIAMALGTGSPWAGCEEPLEELPVAYFSGEGAAGFARRVRAWSTARGVALWRTSTYLIPAVPTLTAPEDVAAVETELDRITAEEGWPPGLVVLDTFARTLGGADENSNSDVSAVIAEIDKLRARYADCAFLLVHHTGHKEQGRTRGASALPAAVDSAIQVEQDENRTVRVAVTKMRDAEIPQPRAFKLRTVELPGFPTPDGQPMTSAVVDPIQWVAPPAKGKAGRGHNQTRALEILKSLADDAGAGVVPVADWRAAMIEAGMPPNRVSELPRTLARAGLVEIEGESVWLLD